MSSRLHRWSRFKLAGLLLPAILSSPALAQTGPEVISCGAEVEAHVAACSVQKPGFIQYFSTETPLGPTPKYYLHEEINLTSFDNPFGTGPNHLPFPLGVDATYASTVDPNSGIITTDYTIAYTGFWISYEVCTVESFTGTSNSRAGASQNSDFTATSSNPYVTENQDVTPTYVTKDTSYFSPFQGIHFDCDGWHYGFPHGESHMTGQLSNEFTTEQLINKSLSQLDGATFGPALGSPIALRNLTSNETSITVQKTRYRLKVPLPLDPSKTYEVHWVERFIPENGGTTVDVEKSAAVDNTTGYTTEMVLSPPSQDGMTQVIANVDFQVGEVTLDDSPLPPDGKSTTFAHASIDPPTRTIRWSIHGVESGTTLGCKIDPNTGKITAGKEAGEIMVRASDSEAPSCNYSEARLKIGCDSCKTCVPGSGAVSNSSVDVQINLGFRNDGKSAGSLDVHEEFPGMLLYSPATLHYVQPGTAGVEPIRDASGVLRQVKTPQALADVVAISSFKYEVRFYKLSDVGPKEGDYYTVGGSPFSVWSIEDPDQLLNSFQKVRVTETVDGTTKVHDFEWDGGAQGWQLSQGNGLRRDLRSSSFNPPTGVTTRTQEVRNVDGTTAFKVSRLSKAFPWGESIIQEVIDPNGVALASAWTYYENEAQTGKYSRLKSVQRADGPWVRYDYDAEGREILRIESWKDVPLASGTSANARATTTSYQPVDPSDVAEPNDVRPRLETTSVEGQVVSKTFYAYINATPGEATEIMERCSSPSAAYGDPSNLRTVTVKYPEDDPEDEIPAAFTDGKAKRIRNPDRTMTFYEYLEDAGQRTVTETTGEPNAGETAIVDGTRTVTVTDLGGNVLSETVHDIAGGLLLSSALTTQTDDFGRPTRIEYHDGTFVTRLYGCCGLESETDREGVTTSFLYDELGRLIVESRAGLSTLYSYDAEGRVTGIVRKGSDGSEIIQEQAVTYNVAGQKVFSRDAFYQTTVFSDTVDGNGHRIKQTIAPGGLSRIETYHRDGSLFELGGTAVHPLKYDYGVEASGTYTKEIRLGQGGSETEWIKTSTDFLGRAFKTTTPDGAVSQSFFNDKDQSIRQVDPDGVVTLFAYNGRGQRETVAVDLDRNGVIDFGGTDRITQTVSEVAAAHGTTVRRTTVSVWSADNADTSSALSVQETSADGLQSWSTTLGMTTHSQTAYGGGGSRTVTVTAPDDSVTVSQFQDGRQVSATQYDSLNNPIAQTTVGYDPHGRQTTITDARTGETVLSYNDLDQITSTSTAGLTTSYSYDESGRRTQITFPDSGTVNYEYFNTGELKKTYGARTYTSEYTYDDQGRIKTLLAGAGTTTWNYDNQRGFLTSKIYDDGKGPHYTYTPAGRLQTRTWARAITTTYGYNNAGELSGIDYSDSTPDVSQNHDRLGRIASVGDGAGAHAMTYNLLGRPLNESHAGGPLDGTTVARTYALNRLATLGATKGATPLSSVSYGYDAASRLQTVTDGTRTATYGYVPNSSLVGDIVFQNGGNTVLTTSKSYDNLNRLTSIQNVIPSLSRDLSFSYTYNDANQRTRLDLADGSYWVYQYDALGQVTSGKKYFSDGTAVSGQQFDYAFDEIGNRVSTTTNGRNASYSANNLNQYLQRDVPGAFDVLGTAKADATVTVNNQPTSRAGEYFHGTAIFDNSTAPVFESVNVVGVKNNVGANGEDAVTEESGHIFLPKTPEAFSYDDDGNLLSDGRWLYTWDGENRLIRMETRPDVAQPPSAVVRQKLEFAYDYQGRRVSKKVYEWHSGSSSYQLQATRYFIYNEWNLLAELDGSGNLVRSYTWGLDLSGSPQGAGGVGGLLFSTQHSVPRTQCFSYDGNGNVVALVDMEDGTIAGEYEYSPFGDILREEGAAAGTNPFRFSSKYSDLETGLVYYGYRYLNPGTGRWVNRDPIGEQGGEHLYNFVGNNPNTSIDPLGLAYGPHLTKKEAEQLSCALRKWLTRARIVNAAFFWGDSNRSLTLSFLKRYLEKTGDQTLPYSIIGNTPEIGVANSAALKHYSTRPSGTPWSYRIIFTGDLSTSIGRALIEYSNTPPGKEISGRIHDRYYFGPDTAEESKAHLNARVPYLDRYAKDCCWYGGDHLSDAWMNDLENFGYAQSFWTTIQWTIPSRSQTAVNP